MDLVVALLRFTSYLYSLHFIFLCLLHFLFLHIIFPPHSTSPHLTSILGILLGALLGLVFQDGIRIDWEVTQLSWVRQYVHSFSYSSWCGAWYAFWGGDVLLMRWNCQCLTKWCMLCGPSTFSGQGKGRGYSSYVAVWTCERLTFWVFFFGHCAGLAHRATAGHGVPGTFLTFY